MKNSILTLLIFCSFLSSGFSCQRLNYVAFVADSKVCPSAEFLVAKDGAKLSDWEGFSISKVRGQCYRFQGKRSDSPGRHFDSFFKFVGGKSCKIEIAAVIHDLTGSPELVQSDVSEILVQVLPDATDLQKIANRDQDVSDWCK